MAQTPTTASTSTSITAVTETGAASANNAPGDTRSAVDRILIKEGYRAVRRHGTIFYCQTQTVTGSKFVNTVCRTAEQIQELKHP